MGNRSWSRKYQVEIEYEALGDRVRSERWLNERGQIDRPGDLPAIIMYDPEQGTIINAEWYRDGQLHRDGDKPAIVSMLCSPGIVTYEAYFKNDVPHRDGDNPAEINRYDDGKPSLIYYYRNGELHRDRGPARVSFSETDGKPDDEEFWQNGRRTHMSASAGPGLEIK